jgi:SAM-dependent methyltransferase
MTDGFDKPYWDAHWQRPRGRGAEHDLGPNPHLSRETVGLLPGTALDAGCGEGAEALWLAAQGWAVTAVDISSVALARARERARARGSAGGDRVAWVEADLSTWEPDRPFDLVATLYAHPAMSQLAFYARLSGWVAPGGTLLVVGHLHSPSESAHGHEHEHEHEHGHEPPPEELTATAAGVAALLDAAEWDVVTAAEQERTAVDPGGRAATLLDVVVRATRQGGSSTGRPGSSRSIGSR